MAYIKFKRNQTNEATEMLLNVDNIVTILSTGVTNLTIKTALVTKDDEILVYTLQVAALAGVTLTRPSIVQSVIDTIQLAGTDGGNAPTVPTLEVQSVGIAGGAA
jgi:hypothetical protein|tara:strand:- start:442 stop:756 length:315 start_codon:yes stop_codon:yes gene_type:complete